MDHQLSAIFYSTRRQKGESSLFNWNLLCCVMRSFEEGQAGCDSVKSRCTQIENVRQMEGKYTHESFLGARKSKQGV